MGNNIPVPYSSVINGGIHDGTDVVISGRPHHNCERFSINLCTGPNYDSGDVALHFNPRFDQGSVVRTNKQNGGWGPEETAGGMPFRRNVPFNMHMKVHNHGYKVMVNNRHFCDFTHRMSKECVQYLYIEGGLTINFIQFRGQGAHVPGHTPGYPPAPSYPVGPVPPSVPSVPGYPPAGAVLPGPGYPPAGPGYPPSGGFPSGPGYPPAGGFPSGPGFAPAPPYPGGMGGPIFNPPVPVNTPIQGGFHPGKIIYITGVATPGASRFHVNLACGFMEQSDLALHLDVRFNYGSDRNVVVRTHRQGGNYGSEERHAAYFPFVVGANFEMMLLCEPNCVKIAVNNAHFTEFNHRIQPIQRVDHVQVQGDVTISQIRFQ